jgi:hypothetical protein
MQNHEMFGIYDLVAAAQMARTETWRLEVIRSLSVDGISRWFNSILIAQVQWPVEE